MYVSMTLNQWICRMYDMMLVSIVVADALELKA